MKTQQKHYRGHGRGTLIQQSSGLFLAKWAHGGRTYVRSTKTHDKDEALKKLDEFVKPFLEQDQIAVLENLQAKVRTIEKRKESEEQKKVNQTLLKNLFGTYIDALDDDTISDQTIACYKSYARQYVAWMNENFKTVTTLGQVTQPMNQKFLKHLEETRSNATYNAFLLTLRKMFVLLLHNPSLWDFKKKPEKVVYERRALTSKELKRLLKYVANDTDLNVLFQLGIYTGMRLSDSAMIKWSAIDLEHKLISIVPIKLKRYNKTVHIPIHPKLLSLLKRLSKGVKDRGEYVSSLNAHRYSTKSLANILKVVFMECNINDGHNHLAFHSLRHTFVSVSANAGVPLPIVQAIVGHSSAEMTNRYYHLDGNLALKAMSKISW